MVTAILTALVFILVLVIAWQYFHTRSEINRAVVEYCIALDFISEEAVLFPHHFSAIFMAGNVQAMHENYPEWFDFRRTWLEEYGEHAE